MRYRNIPLTFLAAFLATYQSHAQSLQSAPKLVVSISVDQLRTDYLEAFSPLYGEHGFKKLLRQSKIYSNVSYPFSPIDRASAIAAISTGTTPYYNSIIGERWLNKETLRPVYCVDDSKYSGILTNDDSSPTHLCTSAIGDELKVSTNGEAKVYGIAPFRDAAIISAGHAADGAFWIDDNNGNWCTSSYYYKDAPGWLKAINSVYSAAIAIDKAWEPDNKLSGTFSYFMSGGIQKSFRHVFSGARRFHQYKTSGMVNETVTEMSLQCIGSNALGADRITDLLCITYYAGSFDHKPVTECQMEIQDTYVRLDREIGRFIESVEKRVGANNVVFFITSTGYSDEENTDYAKYKIPSGTFYINRTANLLNMYYGALWEPDTYVETCFGPQIFLNHKLLERKKISVTEATGRGQEFLSLISGVRNVYTSQQLLTTVSEQTEKIRSGFNAERNGDLLIEVAPGWRLLNEENLDNQISRASFIQFPIIIYGTGIEHERITTHVTTDRIAPTIAKTIRIRAPNACSSAPLF